MRSTRRRGVRLWVVRGLLVLSLAGFVFAATGCNTWKGAGKDVEKAGEKMQGD